MTISVARRALCIAVDIESWSGRLVPEQIRAQESLVSTVRAACTEAVLPAELIQPSGDGILVMPPSGIDENRVIPDFVRGLRTALLQENRLLSSQAKIRLKLSLTSGMVTPGPAGYGGVAIVECFRLLNSPPVRQALIDHGEADLAVIVSDRLFQEVIRHGFRDLRPEEFWPVDCSLPEKGFSASAWAYVSERGTAPLPERRQNPAPEEEPSGEFADVRAQLAAGRPREALALLEKVAGTDPVVELDLRADALLLLDEPEAACESLTRLLELSPPPGPASALIRLGRCKAALGDLVTAHSTLSYLLKHRPENEEGLLELGRVERTQGRHSDARGHLLAGLRLAVQASSLDRDLLQSLSEELTALPS